MSFNIIKSFKLFLLKYLAQWLLSLVSMIIRRNYTKISRGKDSVLDLHIRYVAVQLLYKIDIRTFEEIEIDEQKIEDIQSQLSNYTKDKIDVIKKVNQVEIECVKKIYTLLDFKDQKKKLSKSSIETKQLKIIKLLNKIVQNIHQYNIEKRYFSDLTAVKFEITYDQVIKLISIAAPILLLGGIFKQFILSKLFNFELSTVFSFSDYISSSIDTLIYSIYPLIIYLISSFWGYHEETRLDELQKNWGYATQIKMLTILKVSIIIETIVFYFKSKQLFYIFLPLMTIVVSLQLLSNMSNRLFKNSISAFAFMFLSLNFFAFIYSNTMQEYLAMSEKSKIKKHYFTNTSNSEISDINLITSGTYYSVFWDNKNSKTLLIKREEINKVEIIDETLIKNSQKP